MEVINNKEKIKEIFDESFAFLSNQINDVSKIKNVEEDEASFTQEHLEEFFNSKQFDNSKKVDIPALISKYRESIKVYYKAHKNKVKKSNTEPTLLVSQNDLINILKKSTTLKSFNPMQIYQNRFDHINAYPELKSKNESKEEQQELYSFESQYIEQNISKNNIEYSNFIKSKINVFNENYDFERNMFFTMEDPSEPTYKEIKSFCKVIITTCKMEKEMPIICLIYIEKLLSKTGILLNSWNWRRFTFVALMLASKVLINRYGMMNHLKIFISTKCFPKLA